MVSTFYCLAEDYHSVNIISVIRENRIRTVQRPEVNKALTTVSTQLAEIMKFMVSTFYCLAEDYHSVTIISVIRESRIRTVQRPEVNTAPTTASTQLAEIMKFMVSTFYCLAEDYHSVTIISVIRESRIRTAVFEIALVRLSETSDYLLGQVNNPLAVIRRTSGNLQQYFICHYHFIIMQS